MIILGAGLGQLGLMVLQLTHRGNHVLTAHVGAHGSEVYDILMAHLSNLDRCP